MTLAPGTRLGSHEIQGSLGAGGMGEVYRATDTKLGREVAIKVLPEEVSTDPERLARFEREARILASLNHSNIATLFGFETEGDTSFLIMELVEGETLAEHIARGPISVNEALPLFLQIAEGLEAAHEKGVIHRDLKPANIKITDDSSAAPGRIKILDFGLAKAMEPEIREADLSHSPTLTAAATRRGEILGTAAYMSPEQAEGKGVDQRTDIWAFGCCLFEGLSADRAFASETAQGTLARILEREPDWERLPRETPWRVGELLRRCLRKDPRQRLHHIADARLELTAAVEGDTAGELGSRRLAGGGGRATGMAGRLGVALLVGAVLGIASYWAISGTGREPAAAPRTHHLPLATPPSVVLSYAYNPNLSLSPDGRWLVYVGSSPEETLLSKGLRGPGRLYLQHLDGPGRAEAIPGSEGGYNPFVSPDGDWLAFVSGNRLVKVALTGGAPVELAEVTTFRGGAWSPDGGQIYFVPSLGGRIWKVAADGGEPRPVTTPDRDGYDNSHLWPQVLPGGGALLYTSCCGRIRIAVADLETGQSSYLLDNAFAATYLSTGHLVYAQGHSLMAARFDPERLDVGIAVKILDSLLTGHEHHAEYSFSETGLLAYLSGTSADDRVLVRADRTGEVRPLAAAPRFYGVGMRFSPDGSSLAYSLRVGQTDVYDYDLVRGGFSRLTSCPSGCFWPVWEPDGGGLAFTSLRRGYLDLYRRSADQSGLEELLLANEYSKWASSWSPDGSLLAFTQDHPETGLDIWFYSTEQPDRPRPFLATPFNEGEAAFSPDGGWLAYWSDESGQTEIYVVPYPGPGPRCKVSTAGGEEPRWSRSGRQLFYRRHATAMVVEVSDRDFCHAQPRALFDGLEDNFWDVSPDGETFVTLEPREPPRLHIVLNWFDELERLVPTAN